MIRVRRIELSSEDGLRRAMAAVFAIALPLMTAAWVHAAAAKVCAKTKDGLAFRGHVQVFYGPEGGGSEMSS
jgi:hypothetical protein